MKIKTSGSNDLGGESFLSFWEVLLFLVCSVGCMALVYGSVLWDRALLAPLDVPAAQYAKYQWVDPTQGPTPNNPYLGNLFVDELPRQFSVYRAVAGREIP